MLPDGLFDDHPPVSPYALPVKGVLVDPQAGDLISVSFNPAWLPYVLGALTVLTLDTTWKIEPPNTQELQQKRAMTLLSQFMNAAYSDRPFFQDAEEADDTTLPDYPWYENVEDWIISLFLAITFTPGASIAYRVTIPKLRLAFRTGNIGTIFKVFIDDLEYLTGDSYAPIEGLIEKIIDVQGFATAHNLGTGPHMLKIQAVATTGRNELAVVRGDIRDEEGTLLFRQTDCGLETSPDGETWTSIYDPTNCIQGIVNTTVGDLIDNGTLQKGGVSQPGPSSPPAAGGCKTYHVSLSARDVWLCPSPVNSRDTVHVTNAKGGWNDGGPFPIWHCPNGTVYALGTCQEATVTEDTDPINTLPHMMLVGHIVSTYFDPTTAYTVPNGTVDQPFYLQANDSALADNQGSIEFDVEVCTGQAASRFCHEFDFTVSDQDWYAIVYQENTYAVYNAGAGWGFGWNGYNVIERNFGDAARGSAIDTVEVWRDFTPDSGRVQLLCYNQDNQPSATLFDTYAGFSRATVGSLIVDTWEGLTYVDIMKLRVFGDVANAQGHVVKIIVRGNGAGPYANNCE